MEESLAEEIYKEVPCRKQQVCTLLALMGEKDDWVVPSIFLYGHNGTGKSMVVNTIMETCQLPHVVVNCVECFTSRLLYEHILNHVAQHQPSASNDYTNHTKCDNMNDFVRALKQAREGTKQTFYIVINAAERLRDMEVNLLPGLLRLQELSGLNVCVLLLTEIVWEKFRTGTGVIEPFVMHFQDYSKDNLLEIMSLDCPSEHPVIFYKTYLNLLLSVFYLVCRNLSELRHLAQLNFHKYTEPVVKGEANYDDTRKLWRNIEPHLKKALQTVYLREVSSAQWEKMQQDNAENTLQHGLSSRVNIELPFYSKYMLIGAYLASYNPAKTDKRFFTKNAGKINKRAQLAQQKKHDRTTNQLLGPKPFALDRLMAIFYSIVDSKVAPTANIFSQISSLVSLGLLAQVASHDQIESPKYKCLVNLDFVKGIARTVNFEVIRYLYDFV